MKEDNVWVSTWKFSKIFPSLRCIDSSDVKDKFIPTVAWKSKLQISSFSLYAFPYPGESVLILESRKCQGSRGLLYLFFFFLL